MMTNSSLALRTCLLIAAAGMPACDELTVLSRDAGDAGRRDAMTVDGGRDAASDVGVGVDVREGNDVGAPIDVRVNDSGPQGVDDSTMDGITFPRTMNCGGSAVATLTAHNAGSTTWSTAAGYALGAVDDSDPFYTGDTRVRFGDGMIAPGAMQDFEIRLVAPDRAGDFVTDWRMVHDGVRWFGETTSHMIHVQCDRNPPRDFNLANVTIISSPDVRGFAVTSRLTSIAFRPGNFHIDHTLRGTWPPVQIDPDGTTQEATVWVFFRIGGRWLATGGERLRPAQADKMLTRASDIGPGWLYDENRWREMTGYVPAPGEWVGFMVVAGSTRSDDHVIVRERTGVVLVPFPQDGVDVSYPPFAYQE